MLNEEQTEDVKKIATEVAAEVGKAIVAELDASQITRKFNAGIGAEETTSPATVTSSPEEKLMDDPNGGFANFAEFASAVSGKGAKFYGNGHFEKLQSWESAVSKVAAAGHMNEGDMSQGGYLVPAGFIAQLLQTKLETAIVAGRATHIPVSTNRVTIPAVVDADHTTNFFGGIIVYRTAEKAAKTASKPALGQVSLTLHKLTGLCYVSDELLEDSPISIDPILSSLFGQSIAFEEDDDYLMGTGVARPLGAFNAGNPSLLAQAAEAGQAADTIVFQNIVNMWSRVHPACMRNAVWVVNNECFPQLATMSMAVGTGGMPVYIPANGAAGAPFGTLMGRPLILSEKMGALGDQGDIGIADFSQYLVADKVGGSVKAASSIHLKFDYDETAFRWVLRYDGQPWWLSAITPKRGAATLSPFVVLAERA